MPRVTRLRIVLLLNLALVTGLVIVGIAAHSIGVLAAGGDYLADAAAIGVSLLAIRLSQRRPTPKRPLGFPNATKFAALLNGGWLLILSVLVGLIAARRLVGHRPHVSGLPVLVVSGIAAALMLVGALILGADMDADGDDEGGDLNMRAVLLDTAADAAAAGGVAVTGGVIVATGGWYWLDPAVALVIAVIIGYHAVALVRSVVAALRDLTPPPSAHDVR